VPRCRSRRSAALFGDEIAHRHAGRRTPAGPRMPLALRLLDETTLSQISERVIGSNRGQSCDTAAAHGHDDFAAGCSVADVAAELVVQLTHTDLTLERVLMWRHADRCRRHIDAGTNSSLSTCGRFKDRRTIVADCSANGGAGRVRPSVVRSSRSWTGECNESCSVTALGCTFTGATSIKECGSTRVPQLALVSGT